MKYDLSAVEMLKMLGYDQLQEMIDDRKGRWSKRPGRCLCPVVCGGVVRDRRHEKENGAGMKIKIVRHVVSLR